MNRPRQHAKVHVVARTSDTSTVFCCVEQALGTVHTSDACKPVHSKSSGTLDSLQNHLLILYQKLCMPTFHGFRADCTEI